MKIVNKVIKIVFEKVEADEKEIQQRLDNAFDLLFEEVLKTDQTFDKNLSSI